MAFCITFTTLTVRNSAGAGTTSFSLPVFTTTTAPQSCALMSMTGSEYQALRTGVDTANANALIATNNSTTAINNASTATNLSTTANTNSSTAINNAASAQSAANAVNALATTANTLAAQAKTIADNAMAQTNALANITQGLNTFNQVFAVPNSSMLGQAWAVGFILPMTLGLIAWAVSSLVNFWRS